MSEDRKGSFKEYEREGEGGGGDDKGYERHRQTGNMRYLGVDGDGDGVGGAENYRREQVSDRYIYVSEIHKERWEEKF